MAEIPVERDRRGAFPWWIWLLAAALLGGTVALIEANPKELKVVSQFDANIAQSNWPHPVIAHGKLYLRGEDTIRCYDVRQKK